VNSSLLIIVVMFALLWFLMIRPQRAKQQEQRRMLDSVAPGDEVLMVGGLFGIVQEIDEDGDLIVEIAEGIHVRVARRAIATLVKPDDGDADESDETDDTGHAGDDVVAAEGQDVEDEAEPPTDAHVGEVKNEVESVKDVASVPATPEERS
jgi:preprotein translocase subunit YajC